MESFVPRLRALPGRLSACIAPKRDLQTSVSRQPALAAANPLAQTCRLHWQLSKGKLTVWVALSSLPSYFMCGASSLDPAVGGLVLGTAMASASANALNQVFERHRDKVMARTKGRPIPSGRMQPESALKFATVSGCAGVGLLSTLTEPVTALLAAGNIGAYAGVYTPLKVVSKYNTHVGAVVGSVPILMGWTAAGGSLLTPAPWVLFAIQTMWQFPHFYALAWLHREDYTRGGFKMFPLCDETGKRTAAMIRPWLFGLSALPLVTSAAGATSFMFVLSAAVPNWIFYKQFQKFEAKPSRQTARTFFLHSLWHLFALLGLGALHTFVPAVGVGSASSSSSGCPAATTASGASGGGPLLNEGGEGQPGPGRQEPCGAAGGPLSWSSLASSIFPASRRRKSGEDPGASTTATTLPPSFAPLRDAFETVCLHKWAVKDKLAGLPSVYCPMEWTAWFGLRMPDPVGSVSPPPGGDASPSNVSDSICAVDGVEGGPGALEPDKAFCERDR
uniref:Heme O synthase n=1 Tax=Chromera velia CCMP2878 TaxID=1169474 RepID=A0A0G4I7E2_9ALVE|mmetsp:Transcript_28685/g.56178  ORF Transcript_28685/g.56178 Transcript_28685/m.56178 type:complete len:505 (+) Transcript_28685:216-1730(+)|eukprot:Cvel_11582.t1-p1 / transcript=Cvel_11582.t1 / gene=Cvel_11582 / organism=Chromera_velia_CCMP2878 / gene_product=Protoheme IX farnesyltransferase, mitochondrial, putative / transcript_product=Protoheme IX farnesyltransferase, mitochondrial, putative / location=Cvel_scaffold732:40422-43986(+) / protein_length=504 / sequence_SO=supercontig / SO=protein_coding / is_pseudo=false